MHTAREYVKWATAEKEAGQSTYVQSDCYAECTRLPRWSAISPTTAGTPQAASDYTLAARTAPNSTNTTAAPASTPGAVSQPNANMSAHRRNTGLTTPAQGFDHRPDRPGTAAARLPVTPAPHLGTTLRLENTAHVDTTLHR
jgi:hypothetical protein